MSNWTMVATNSTKIAESAEERAARQRRMRKFDNTIRNIKPLNEEELKKEANAAYIAEEARKDSLVAAYDAKKLKSATLIREARAIKHKRAEAAKKVEIENEV